MTATQTRVPTPADIREELRGWLSTVQIPVIPSDHEERFDTLREWQRTLFDSGWMGLDWSVKAGGRGLTPQHQFAFVSELAAARAPAPIGLIGLDVVGPTIDAFGTDEQRERYLPDLLSGADIWCQGFSEPDAGSDLVSLRTSAVREGELFRVNGQKIWTSWAGQATRCALLCRTDPAGKPRFGLSYLIVDMDSPGITVRPIEQLTGDAEFCEVFFDDVEVPHGNLVGAEGAGWSIAGHTLSRERSTYSMRRLLDLGWLVEDTLDRLRAAPAQWGADPAVAVGRATVALTVLDAAVRRTVARLTADPGPSPRDSIDKLILNEAEQEVCAALVSLAGPFRAVRGTGPGGIDWQQLNIAHYFSRAASIYGGTSQIQKNIVAERLLGMPRG
jgi:alkylation response protein AidB-like acyl-CoA dehydrogenase